LIGKYSSIPLDSHDGNIKLSDMKL